MSIADKLITIANNSPKVYDAGYEDGRGAGFDEGLEVGYGDGFSAGEEAGIIAEAAKCAAKHYVAHAVGDGTSAITFDIPFEPDYISISSFNPFAITKADQIIGAICDTRSFGKLASLGVYCRTDSGATTLLLSTQNSAAEKFVIENGVCTVKNLGTSSTTGNQVVFRNGEEYLICAVKYTDKTDKEHISEYISALSDDGGSISVSQMKKEAAFTDEEWQTLIATKPNWTFVLV